jgi:hypothetical protein
LVITYNALKRESKLIGEPEVFAYQTALRAMAEMLHAFDKIYDFAQQLAIRPPRGFDSAASDKFLALLNKIADEHLTRTTNGRRRTRKDDNYNAMTEHQRRLRDALFCLNPMCLTAEQLTTYLPPDLAPMFRVSTRQGVSNVRSSYWAYSTVTPIDPNKTAKEGRRLMLPIDPDTGAKYYQTYECNKYGHGATPFYKYHAIAWGRKRYAEILADMGYVTCPVYGVSVSDYTSPIRWPDDATHHSNDDPLHPMNCFDLRYLELAEWDALGLLPWLGTGPISQRKTTIPTVINLPMFVPANDGQLTKDDFDNFKVSFLTVTAQDTHNVYDPSWHEANANGTTVNMFVRKLLHEKARYMPMLEDELHNAEYALANKNISITEFNIACRMKCEKYSVRNNNSAAHRAEAFKLLAAKCK